MRRRVAAVALVAVVVPGCGSASADLFRVERTGEGEGAALTLVVSDDGTARCNGAAPRPVGAGRLLEARQLTRDLARQAALGLELPQGPPEDTTFRYRAETAEGTISFADSSRGIPPTYTRLAGLTRVVARQVCNLPR